MDNLIKWDKYIDITPQKRQAMQTLFKWLEDLNKKGVVELKLKADIFSVPINMNWLRDLLIGDSYPETYSNSLNRIREFYLNKGVCIYRTNEKYSTS